MTKIFFSSDQHLGHFNIIKYCNRPFKTVEEMDEYYIEKWNSVVGLNDIVYHLGDFALSTTRATIEYFKRLNGCVYLIRGNHDHWTRAFSGLFVTSNGNRVVILRDIHVASILEESGNRKVVLCHYPLREWPGYYQGAYHLYGHVHGTIKPVPGSLDVGVDTFPSPVEASQISKLIVPHVI